MASKFEIFIVGAMTGIIAAAVVDHYTGRNESYTTQSQRVEMRDVNKDGIDDVVITTQDGYKTPFIGFKQGGNIIYLSLKQIKERYEREFKQSYGPLEKIKLE